MAKKKINAHVHVKQIMSELEKEKTKKSFLDRPIKDIFSFNVDGEIRDNADRSRSVIDHFNRNGITITTRRKLRFTRKAIPYLILSLLVILFVLIVVPGIFTKALFLMIGSLFLFYYIFKILKT